MKICAKEYSVLTNLWVIGCFHQFLWFARYFCFQLCYLNKIITLFSKKPFKNTVKQNLTIPCLFFFFFNLPLWTNHWFRILEKSVDLPQISSVSLQKCYDFYFPSLGNYNLHSDLLLIFCPMLSLLWLSSRFVSYSCR